MKFSILSNVSSCNPSWPILSDFEKCQLYSLKVYDNIKNILYKNPHCAKCNYASFSKKQFSCTDLKPSTKQTSFGFQSPTFRAPTFSILFQIPNRTPRKCSKRDEIWSPFDDQCSKIICGLGRVLIKGKCVKSEYENYESNVPQRSFLLKSCPTVAVRNFTLYDNDSVYHYTGNKLYEKGEYELYNDSIVLICAENKFYFKKNFLFSYYTTVVVLSISLVCLVFHMSLYFCYSRLRTWHGRNLLYLCFSLFIAQFLFLTGTTATENFEFCVFMAVCIHYFWLASFFWMNILSIDVWRTFKAKFSHSSNNRKVFLIYNLYSWGVPFIIVMVSLTLDLASKNSKYKPNYAGIDEAELCWINNKIGLLCFFLLPVAIIITENLILFTITSYKIYSQSKETKFAKVKSQSMKVVKEENLSEEEKKRLRKQEKTSKNNKIRFILYLKLGILQGLTWVFGFLASYVDSSICWYIFTILNGLQGAAIVLCFDVKKWILDSVWRNISIVSLGSRFSKSTKTTPFENDLAKDENGRNESKKAEKKSSCKKRKSLIKAKDSAICSSSPYKSSQKYKSFTRPSSENVSSDSGIASSRNNDKYSENSKTLVIFSNY
ncbi:putative G-protein coupled receptor Mth-like 4 [Armadillidium vulgare]|nr:putative G-protein coupled receptor Mth-like 4 [Armadillidium vulgare]